MAEDCKMNISAQWQESLDLNCIIIAYQLNDVVSNLLILSDITSTIVRTITAGLAIHKCHISVQRLEIFCNESTFSLIVINSVKHFEPRIHPVMLYTEQLYKEK